MKDFGELELKLRKWFYQTVEKVDLTLSQGQGVVVPSTLPRLKEPKGMAPRYILRVEVEPVGKPSWYTLLGLKEFSFTKDCVLKIQRMSSGSC